MTDKATPQPAEAPKAKRPIVLTPCLCGCNTEVARRFAPGHDARWASALVTAWELGQHSREAAIETATAVSEGLGRKVRHSIESREAKAAAKQQATPAKAADSKAKPAAKTEDK